MSEVDKRLRVIEQASLGVVQARYALHGAVAAARQERATWREIGKALGVTAQAAQQRYGP